MTKKKIYQSKICIGCANEFNNLKSRTENEYLKQKYCGLPCFRKNIKQPKGNKSILWKGGIQYHKGYRYLYMPFHPNRARELYVGEHRLVMELKLKRFLIKGEYVHHINGDRLDNRPENLHLCRNLKDHNAIHRQMNELMNDLIKKGVVVFNVKEVKYYLSKDQK